MTRTGERATPAEGRAQTPASPAPAAGRILVVDDEYALVTAYTRILRTTGGYHVATATDGVTAVQLVERELLVVDVERGGCGYDVVVSDVSMPGMSGLELLRAVRLQDPSVQVVLQTGAPTPADADLAASEGALLYLNKPVDGRVLLQIVNHACRVRRAILRRAAPPAPKIA